MERCVPSCFVLDIVLSAFFEVATEKLEDFNIRMDRLPLEILLIC